MTVLDLFSGPGGWATGAHHAGISTIGIDLDPDACRTHHTAGHPTIRADITTYPLEHLDSIDGLIASPPCTDFSLAGNQAGITGATGKLMHEVPRWVRALHPRWVACEQVPQALEWWNRFAVEFRELGYRTWTGVLNAADYGVPQTRRRAFLLASLDREPGPPLASHGRDPQPMMFGEPLLPWVSMAAALGWSGPVAVGAVATIIEAGEPDGYRERDWREGDEPAFALTEKARSWTVRTGANSMVTGARILNGDDCCRTLTGIAESKGIWKITDPDGQRIGLTVADALILQSFPADYPVHGTKTSQFRQIGNAVPPVLAAAVLRTLA